MSLDTPKNRSYQRPYSAYSYLNFGNVVRGNSDQYQEVSCTVPSLAKLRPSGEFNYFEESTGVPGAVNTVICAGNLIPVVQGGNTKAVGVLKHDTAPGLQANVIVNGEFLLRPDWEGASSPARTACSSTGLLNKPAYYIIETGTVSDVAPNNSDYYGWQIGYFTEDELIDTGNAIAGGRRAAVMLDYSLMLSNTAQSQVADAANNNMTNSIYASVSLDPSGVSGLIQTLSADVVSGNPAYPAEAANLAWTIEGVAQGTGFSKTVAFTAGAGKTIQLVVTLGNGDTVTKNYTVTISASAAPSSFVEV